MEMSEAWKLRLVSYPFLILVVVCLPLSFFIVLIKLGRKKYLASKLRPFIGSLIEKYRPNRAWWELIRILIKLLIAVFLKALDPFSAWRPVLVISVLIVGAASIFALWKYAGVWKRDLEHLMEAASWLLLSVTFTSRLTTAHANSPAVLTAIVTIDAIFAALLFGIWIHASWTEVVPRPALEDSIHDDTRRSSNDHSSNAPLTSPMERLVNAEVSEYESSSDLGE
jgi:hypothetical protein